MSENNGKICLTPGCGEKRNQRGLCTRCATTARNMVKAGETTWEELESLGLALRTNAQVAPLRMAVENARKKKEEQTP